MAFELEKMEEGLRERYELASDRIQELIQEGEDSLEPWLEEAVLSMARGIDQALTRASKTDRMSQWKKERDMHLTGKAPGEDPMVAYLDTVSYMMAWIPSYVESGRMEACLIHMELFLELLGVLKDGDADGLSQKRLAHNIQQTLYYFLSDYGDLLLEDYLGYWFASASFYELPGYYDWAKREGEDFHKAHQYDLAYFLNHNTKERMLFQCAFWQGKTFFWKEWNEDSLERFHPKQRKLLLSFREGLQRMEQEA